jgi:hypothetical protein
MDTTSNRQVLESATTDRVEAVNAELMGARWEVDFLTKATSRSRAGEAQARRSYDSFGQLLARVLTHRTTNDAGLAET